MSHVCGGLVTCVGMSHVCARWGWKINVWGGGQGGAVEHPGWVGALICVTHSPLHA